MIFLRPAAMPWLATCLEMPVYTASDSSNRRRIDLANQPDRPLCAQDSNIEAVWVHRILLKGVNLFVCGFPGCICSPLSSIRGPHRKANLLAGLPVKLCKLVSLLAIDRGPAGHFRHNPKRAVTLALLRSAVRVPQGAAGRGLRSTPAELEVGRLR